MMMILWTMGLGIAVGYCLRHRRLRGLGNVTLGIIWLLLLLLGVEAGSDERVVHWFASLGLEAFAISLGGVAGSSVLALLLWRYVRRRSVERGDG